jgi:3-hydroxyisobutyrate dehydrogenase-like beta-hydroxyacid dehydrogenase
MRIGFIGLGNMGQPMARNLIRAHHEVVVYNRSREPAEALAKEGAQLAEHPADAANSEVVITMLGDDKSVELIVFGDHGVLQGMKSGGIHVCMTTISPALSQRLAAAHAERKQIYVAAPVFGRPNAAAAAQLLIVAAGPPEALGKIRPVMDALGWRICVVSNQPHHANLVKICGNFLIACIIEGLGEIFALSRKSGLDPNRVWDALSEIFTAPPYKIYASTIIEGKFLPAQFKLPLGLKDVRLALEAGEQFAVPLPFASVLRDHFLSALGKGMGEMDWSAIATVIAEDAGLPAPGGTTTHAAEEER